MRLILVLLLMGVPVAALGQEDPLIGVDRFPQFRNLSGLSGSGYGLDSRGYYSLSGPTALSTPVGPALGHNQVHLAIARASRDAGPSVLRFANGTVVGSFGVTLGNMNVAVSDMLLSQQLDQAFNFQVQVPTPLASRWTGSFGVQDIGGGGGSSGDGAPGDSRTSRSFFGVVTYRADTGRDPVYLSAGWGTRRFANLFGSLSYRVTGPVRVWVEHDGFGVNEGMLLGWRLRDGRRAPELTALFGYIESKYLVLSAGIGF